MEVSIRNKALSIILLLFFFLLVFSPLLLTLKESLTLDGKISFSLYREILKDARLRLIFGRTIWIGIATAITTLLFGLPFAFILERTNLPFKKLFKVLAIIPILIPPYIQGWAWVNLLGEKEFLRDFIIRMQPLIPYSINLYNIKGVIFILTLSYFPFAYLLITTGLRAIDRRLEEAGELSSPPLRSLRKITLPLMLPYIFTSLAFIFILTISEYALPELLRVHNYAFEVCYQFGAFHNFAKATAIALPPVILTTILTLLMAKLMSDRPYISLTGHYRSATINTLHPFKTPALIFCFAIIFLSTICPIGVFIKGIGSVKNVFLASHAFMNEILLSLFLAVMGATLCTFLSLPLASLLENSKGMLKKAINMLTLIPLAIPGAVAGLGIVKMINRPPALFISSNFISILLYAYLIRFSCFGIRIVSAALKTYSKEFREAALLVPTTRLKRFFKITLPLLHPSLVTTWIVSFVFCITELSAVLFLMPPGEITLPMRIELFLHSGNKSSVFAVCLVQILVTVIPILILLPYARLKARYSA